MGNSELFRKIADRVEKNPKTYDQCSFYGKKCGCIFWHAEQILGIDSETSDLHETGELLGLNRVDCDKLFYSGWKPRPDLTVPQALRMIADGASVSEVSA